MLQHIIDFIASNPLVSTAGAALGGLLINHTFGLILGQFWTDKAIINAIRKIDAHIERFKIKYPEAGKQLEDRVLETLAQAVNIIRGIS